MVVVIHTVVCLHIGYKVGIKKLSIAVTVATEAKDLADTLFNEETALLAELQKCGYTIVTNGKETVLVAPGPGSFPLAGNGRMPC